jgi:uncharacterized protein (DUF433 family)
MPCGAEVKRQADRDREGHSAKGTEPAAKGTGISNVEWRISNCRAESRGQRGEIEMKGRKTVAIEIAPRIVVDPRVRFGRPVIKGTRVPVAVILDELAAGTAAEVITREFGIKSDDIRAVLRYAAEMIAGEEVKVASR